MSRVNTSPTRRNSWSTSSSVSTCSSDVGTWAIAGEYAVYPIVLGTGKYRPDLVAASGIEPTATVDSVADVPALLRAEMGN